MEFLQRRRRTILAGVAGAVSAQLGCAISVWFFTLGTTLWEALYYWFLTVVLAPVVIGLVAGLLTPALVSGRRYASFLCGAVATAVGLMLILQYAWQLELIGPSLSTVLKLNAFLVIFGLVSVAAILFVMGAVAWLWSKW